MPSFRDQRRRIAERVECPECEGYGYHEDGTDDGRECFTCHGDGTCTRLQAETYRAAQIGR